MQLMFYDDTKKGHKAETRTRPNVLTLFNKLEGYFFQLNSASNFTSLSYVRLTDNHLNYKTLKHFIQRRFLL